MEERHNSITHDTKEPKMKAQLYKKYSFLRVFIYESSTILHYLTGGLGLFIGYTFLQFGYLIGFIYLIFAFLQMYVLMPLTVCPKCVYYRMEDSRCVSGLNRISQKLAKEGNP